MTPSPNNNNNNNNDNDNNDDNELKNKYYQKGNEEVAKETPLIMRKLEKRRILTTNSERLVIVLVGLPARGKSFLSRKLQHFLKWSGHYCQIFNVGKYRREVAVTDGTADFFRANNAAAAAVRQQAAELALRDMLRWLDGKGGGDDDDENDSGNTSDNNNKNFPQKLVRGMSLLKEMNDRTKPPEADRVAIFDATNSTEERRSWILNECTNHPSAVGVVFVESICDDEELLRENYRYKIKSSPDFSHMTYEEALADLQRRVANYEQTYETLKDDHQSYIKIFNLSTKIMVNHIYGRMAKVIVPAIMAWNVGTRPIFLCRAGETGSCCETTTTTTAAAPPPQLCDLQTLNDNAAAAEDWIQHHMREASSSSSSTNNNNINNNNNNNRRMESKKKKGEKLGANGIKFRNALEDYIETEGRNFMRKQQEAHFDMDTGTSLSGLAAFHTPGQEYYTDDDDDNDDNAADDDDEEEEEEEKESPADLVPPESSSSPSSSFPLVVLTSTLPRAAETAMFQRHSYPLSTSPNLNPLDKGDYTGLELEEIRNIDPQWFANLTRDPYFTRFPGGESYSDLITRLEPVIIDMEQQTAPVLCVSHISVLQALVAYFRQESPGSKECMGLEVPLHTVIKFTPSRGGGWVESRHCLLLQSTSANSSIQSTTMHNSAHSSNSSIIEEEEEVLLCGSLTNSPTVTQEQQQQSVKVSTPIWGDHLLINNNNNNNSGHTPNNTIPN